MYKYNTITYRAKGSSTNARPILTLMPGMIEFGYFARTRIYHRYICRAPNERIIVTRIKYDPFIIR